jgi:hypothetical protein
MNEEAALIPIGNDAIRQIIEDKQSLSIGTLTSSDLRTLKALEHQFWQRLADAGIVREWKVSLRLTFEADVNGCIQVSFGDCTVNLNKLNRLTVKRGNEILFDDREVAQERALPDEWMNEFSNFLTMEAEKRRRIIENQRENEAIEAIVRLKK